MREIQARTERQVLTLLRERGALRLRRIHFRANRSTIWSLTKSGSVLNLHVAFRTAPRTILEQFSVIVREASRGGSTYRVATAAVRRWEGLEMELRRVRREHRSRPWYRPKAPRKRILIPGPDCATPEQNQYLMRLYRYLNRTRFNDRLPPDMTVRLSNRMVSRYGQLVPGEGNGKRWIVEIALNVDLMLEGNGRERIDTLVHEMAHAADWLFNGELGHGPGWRRWARYAGCSENACSANRIRRRRRGVRHVTRVPRLPGAAREIAA